LQTSCKECQFATYDGNTQDGCAANRLSQLEAYVTEAYDDNKEFYVIDCLCNMFRAPAWNGGNPDVEKARQEIKPLFSIVIDADNFKSESLYAKELSRTRESLVKIKYDHKRVAILYSTFANATKETKRNIRQSFDKLWAAGFRPQIVTVIEEKMKDYDTFRKAGCNYFVRIGAGEEVSPTLFSDIDVQLNEKMSRAVVFNREGTLVISYVAYSALFGMHETYESFKDHITHESKRRELYLEI